MKLTRRTCFSCLLLACGTLLVPSGWSYVPDEDVAPGIYHLRIVRVSGLGTDPGAALGYAPNRIQPVTLPEYEAWGTPEQLEALTEALGGGLASPVTGFWLTADEVGSASFEREIYVGESVLRLIFVAGAAGRAGEGHELELILEPAEPTGAPPLAEARMRVRTDRTVAIAGPSVLEGDWLVLAVTPLNSRDVADKIESTQPVRGLKEEDVTRPQLVSQTQPRYPENARRRKIEGHVELQAIVDREGIPRAPMVVDMPPGCEELAASAVEAIQQWRYEPAMLGDEPVSVYMNVTVVFRLK